MLKPDKIGQDLYSSSVIDKNLLGPPKDLPSLPDNPLQDKGGANRPGGFDPLHGTTTVAFKIKDGVILAADRRASAGYLVVSKQAKKIHQLNKTTVMTIAGLVSDAQYLIKLVKAEIELYALSRNRNPTTVFIGNLLAAMLYGQYRRFFPYYVQLLVGGVDEQGPHVYNMDPSGAIGEEDFTSSGSGSVMSFGVLESSWHPDMTKEAGIKLATFCINASSSRDIASGDGIDMMVVTKEGTEVVPQGTISAILEEKMKGSVLK